jgi:hypothetical protein
MIKAIPTIYNGIRFRSRLEARWAAFFDACRWQYTYEPLDFGVWSPDFALHRQVNPPTYLEIKPISKFEHAVIDRMGQIPGYHILVGLNPQHDMVLGWSVFGPNQTLDEDHSANTGDPDQVPDDIPDDCPSINGDPVFISVTTRGRLDLFPEGGDANGLLFGHPQKANGALATITESSARISANWTWATNQVQWQPQS